MQVMAEPYTHAIWRVKPGRAEEFIRRWEEFSNWAMEQTPGILWGVLLRDTEDPDVFISTGAWESSEHIPAWIKNPEALKRTEAIRKLVDHFEPRTMELAAVRDPEEWGRFSQGRERLDL
jgi:heme-degrading monooxygenase HmoA